MPHALSLPVVVSSLSQPAQRLNDDGVVDGVSGNVGVSGDVSDAVSGIGGEGHGTGVSGDVSDAVSGIGDDGCGVGECAEGVSSLLSVGVASFPKEMAPYRNIRV